MHTSIGLRNGSIFQTDFLENETFRESILFYTFDLFLHKISFPL